MTSLEQTIKEIEEGTLSDPRVVFERTVNAVAEFYVQHTGIVIVEFSGFYKALKAIAKKWDSRP